jgi:ribonuclease HIII
MSNIVTFKESLKSQALISQRKAQLLTLKPHYHWTPNTEAYCLYRLDGTTKQGQKITIKQYTKGTFYVQAQSQQGLNQLLSQLGIATPTSVTNELAGSSTNTVATNNLTIQYPYMGCDESGKGDYFGALVTACVWVDEAQAKALKQLGIADSKTLNDHAITRLAKELLSLVGKDQVAVVELAPHHYNEAYATYTQQKKNLNHLLADMHASGVAGVLAQQQGALATTKPLVIVDQFGNASYLTRAFSQQGIASSIKLHQETKAERHIAVAAASVLARYRFLRQIAQLGDSYGITLPLGASNKVDAMAKQLVKTHGVDVLKQIAKYHFKTTQKIGVF